MLPGLYLRSIHLYLSITANMEILTLGDLQIGLFSNLRRTENSF